MYTIVICGPQIYRTALLEHLRAARGDYRVAGQSNHVADAPALIAHVMPDAALLVGALAEPVAVREVKRIRRVDLQAQLVWWALLPDPEPLRAALSEFDVTVVSWESSPDAIVDALGVPQSPGLRTLARPRLTPQEHLILQLAADGLSNKAIGLRLNVTENTVKNHFRNIGAKFNTSSRAQAVWQAVQWGYLTPVAIRA